jgi:hypothetical protein
MIHNQDLPVFEKLISISGPEDDEVYPPNRFESRGLSMQKDSRFQPDQLSKSRENPVPTNFAHPWGYDFQMVL